MPVRIEVKFKPGVVDAAGKSTRKRIFSDLGIELENVRTIDVYTIDKNLSQQQLEKIRAEIFTDPLTQEAAVSRPIGEKFDYAVEVGFLPGVTDNVGNTGRSAVEELLKLKFSADENIYSSRQYLLNGKLDQAQAGRIAGWLHNPLIQRAQVKSCSEFMDSDGMEVIVPKVNLPSSERVDPVELDISDAELEKLGKEGILDHKKDNQEFRRGPLALSLAELKIIRDYFKKLGKKPTDIELESIAQTWSEHCKHKIFAARLDDIDSLYKTCIKRATEEIRARLGDKDWCVSVFKDNSGVIKFNDHNLICYKVETHNSPSALDPYGGAVTGIVGR